MSGVNLPDMSDQDNTFQNNRIFVADINREKGKRLVFHTEDF